jgi:YTH domain-containing family protein
MSAEKSHHRSKTSRYANQRLSFLNQQNISKQTPISFMPSEITVKSYTSRLHIGDPNGNIILRIDQYNKDDFRVVYHNVKFFVINLISDTL